MTADPVTPRRFMARKCGSVTAAPRLSGSSCLRPGMPGRGREPLSVSLLMGAVTVAGEELSEGRWGWHEGQENEAVTKAHPPGLLLCNFPGYSASSR